MMDTYKQYYHENIPQETAFTLKTTLQNVHIGLTSTSINFARTATSVKARPQMKTPFQFDLFL